MTEFEAFFIIAILTFVFVIIIEFVITLFEITKKGVDTKTDGKGGVKDK